MADPQAGGGQRPPADGGDFRAPQADRFPPKFVGVLNKLVRGAAQAPAHDSLLAQVFSSLDQQTCPPCVNGPTKALAERQPEPEPWRAEVRTRMTLLQAVAGLAAAPNEAESTDPLVLAAEHEHEEIELGHVPSLPDAENGKLAADLPPQLRAFAGLPAFQAGRVKPRRMGLVRLGDAQGVFVEYSACRDECRSSTLLAFDSPREPHARVIEFNRRRYWAARHAAHTFVAWRDPRDGWLHVLVTHCSFRNTLALAELLQG